jgi:glycosyltransferase involved in cell wall biosynthesis
MPSHHQSALFAALRNLGVDLVVRYYGTVTRDRVRLGWEVPKALPPYAAYVTSPTELGGVTDWRHRIHLLPGYASWFLTVMRRRLDATGTYWCHWSERSTPGWRWVLSYPVKRWYADRVNRRALGAFGIGEPAIRDFGRWGMRPEAIALLPYAVNPLAASAIPDSLCQAFLNGRKAFLFVGRVSKPKGAHTLLAAFAEVAKCAPDWCLILCGPTEKEYASVAARLGISNRVLFRGVVPASSVAGVFRASDVFVLPSRDKDGWGVALAEAASLGMPLIASETVGAAYHLIEPGVNGFRVSPGDAESLRWAMSAYVRSARLVQIHGPESKKLFERYIPSASARRLVTAIEGWLAMRGRSIAPIMRSDPGSR